MGYRISEENTPRPYTIGVPFYDLNQANRVTDARRRIAEEQVAGIREAGDQTARNLVALVNAPLSAYREQQDREFKKAEFEDQRQARAAAKALAEEQLAGAKQLRELEGEFGARQREAAIGQQEAARNLANLQAKAAAEEQAYYTGEALSAGLPGAQPGQTVRQYELAQGIQQKTGALDLQKSQIELAKAQTEAQRDIAKLNAANAAVEREARLFDLDEAKRARRVNDLVDRLSLAGDDPQAVQAISQEFGKIAKPNEFASAMNLVRKNKMQSDILATELARRDPNYMESTAKMIDASDKAEKIAVIKATADDAIKRYISADLPWDDKADDAIATLQEQLIAAGFKRQAESLNSIYTFNPLKPRQTRTEKAKEAINSMYESIGSAYAAENSRWGEQYKRFGEQLQQAGLSEGQKKSNKFKGIGQPIQSEALQVPMPTRLGPNFYQQLQQNVAPQTAPPPQTINQMLQQENRIPWMGQSNGTIAPQGQSPQMQSPAPMQQNQAPLIQLPPSFQLKKRVTDNGGR